MDANENTKDRDHALVLSKPTAIFGKKSFLLLGALGSTARLPNEFRSSWG